MSDTEKIVKDVADYKESTEKPLRTAAEIVESGTIVAPELKLDQRLISLVLTEPELAKKLAEAITTERYFITVTFQKKYEPNDKHDMQHFWTGRGLLSNDITGALRHLSADYNAKENPTATPDENRGGLY